MPMPPLRPLPRMAGAADRQALPRPARIAVVAGSSAPGHQAATVTDLSLAGGQVALQCRLVEGQFVMLAFPGLAPPGARVAWSRGDASGVTFARPLSAGVPAHLLASHPVADAR